MARIVSCGAAILAAALVVAAASAHLYAQSASVNKRTFLTFSAPVQVLDANGRHVLAQFFFVQTDDRTIQGAESCARQARGAVPRNTAWRATARQSALLSD